MRDDVLSDELERRLGASEEMIRAWFRSLRPADRTRVLGMLDAEIQASKGRASEGVARRAQLESIRNLFGAWMDQGAE
jgi:hypothetical protein